MLLMAHSHKRTTLYTAAALLAFAANSILCRLALGGSSIDAASFSAIRLASGAIALFALVAISRTPISWKQHGNWVSASMLFSAPSPAGAALMLISGMAWGVYSLRGRQKSGALANTAGNFIRTLPMIAVISLIAIPFMHASVKGATLAILSGALASGAGYAIWYSALGGLTTTRAAVVQLSVPVLTALGGVTILTEPISGRLILSSIMILGGIWLTIITHHPE